MSYIEQSDPYEIRDTQNNLMSKYLIDDSHKKVPNTYYHYYDSSLIKDSPQPYHNSQDNIHRRDHRESLNNRLDNLFLGNNQLPYPQENYKEKETNIANLYPNRIQNHVPEKKYVASREEYIESKRQQLSQENKQRILDQIYRDDNNIDPFYQVNYQTSRVSNKLENNQRMLNYIGLPKSMATPINHYSNGNKTIQPQSDIHLSDTNQYSRQNFKDNHNQRLQELVPLSKTAFYGLNSFETAIREQPKINQQSRDENLHNHQAMEVKRMKENIQNLGMVFQPMKITIDKPVDTRM
jgi:hypothetical protein